MYYFASDYVIDHLLCPPAIYVHPNAGKAAAANAKKAADSSMKEKRRSNPYTKSARPRSMPNALHA